MFFRQKHATKILGLKTKICDPVHTELKQKFAIIILVQKSKSRKSPKTIQTPPQKKLFFQKICFKKKNCLKKNFL